MHSKVIQLCIYIYAFFFRFYCFQIGNYRVLGRVPCLYTNIKWYHLYVEFLKNDTNELMIEVEQDTNVDNISVFTKGER